MSFSGGGNPRYDPDKPPDIKIQQPKEQSSSNQPQHEAQQSAMNLTTYAVQMSATYPQLSTMPMGTTYPQPPQGGLQQYTVQTAPMAQQAPFQGQQLLLPPQAYPPGNFPGQTTPWIGQFGPSPATPQPNVGWESAIASAVAAQMGQLHQELKEMKSLIGGRQGSDSGSSSRLSKWAWSDSSRVSDGTCDNCTHWRREYNKTCRDAEGIFASLRDTEREVDLQKREIEILKHELREACALADLAAKPTMMGASQVRERGYTILPPCGQVTLSGLHKGLPSGGQTHVEGKRESSRQSMANPQVGTTARGGGPLSTSAPYGQATLQGSVHMLFKTAELDEFSKANDSVGKQFDPNFPMRRIAGSEVVHDTAYAWWKSVNGKGFIHWYEQAEATFKSGMVSQELHEKAKINKKYFSELPSIAKFAEDYKSPENRGNITWEKLGKAAYIKSQFKPLRTPEECIARAVEREVKASRYRDRDASLHAGQTIQRPSFPTGGMVNLPYSTPEPSDSGTQQPAPTQGAPTSSSSMVGNIAQAMSP